ncbi:MAG: hypothetical protein A2176_03595 [Spirochaetes bacterium RBG_13_51_14]|nr:MAG: hypothetical protein A2176_03595 [Spirochaetes bacterium RBG_13_51_14]
MGKYEVTYELWYKVYQWGVSHGYTFANFGREGYQCTYSHTTEMAAPTEGEWQYAASYIDGSRWTPWNYASGDSAPADRSTTIGNYAWYYGNAEGEFHNVGTKAANRLGIHDMSGNVAEWVWDPQDVYPIPSATDFKDHSPLQEDQPRFICGGSIAAGAGESCPLNRLQVGRRYSRSAHITAAGLRVARSARQHERGSRYGEWIMNNCSGQNPLFLSGFCI